MQHALQFLEAVLPPGGLRVVASKPPGWKKGLRHTFHDTNEALVQDTTRLDGNGVTTYFALASYADPEAGRTAANTSHLQCLWLDVDYKNYEAQEQANDDLRRLSEVVGPPSVVVDSGGGFHAYWGLRSALPTDEWKPLADAFQATWQALNVKADPISADAARILRLPGTHNHKYDPPVRVTMRSFEDITYAPEALAKKLNARPAARMPTVVAVPDALRGGADDLGAGLERRESHLKPLIAKCLQAQYAFANQARMVEPQWFAVLQLARHLVDGRRVAHLFSHQHPGYSVEETDAKLAQLERNDIGPTTCEHFKRVNPAGCQGCQFNITSPIVLGYPEVEAVEPVVTVTEHVVTEDGEAVTVERQERPDVAVPEGFKYDGVFIYKIVKDDETGMNREEPIFDGFMCPERLVVNERDNHKTDIQLYAHSKGQAPKRLTLPAKSLAEKRDLTRELSGRGVLYMSKHAGFILDLLQRMTQDVQSRRRDSAVAEQMGWQDDGMFVVGATGYRPDTSPQFDLPVPASTKGVVRNYEPAGSLEAWKRTAAIYGRKGGEAYQFALCYGAAGIFLPMTQVSGVVLSLYSQSAGRGKSTAGEGALSWWGNPNGLKSQSKDTNNALFHKASRHKNLPLLMDEITDKPNHELEDLVYFMSQGREKERLTSEATARPTLPGWALPVISTSNNSIKAKLQARRGDAQGLFARIVEVPMDLPFAESMGYTDRMTLRSGFKENYGHAGPKLVQHVMSEMGTYQGLLDRFTESLDRAVDGDSAYRFWVASAACTLVAAAAARSAGLLNYDLAALSAWTGDVLRAQKADSMTSIATSDDILSQFLEVNANRIVVVFERDRGAGLTTTDIWPDNGVHGSQLVGRVEAPKRSLFVSLSAFLRFCHETGFDLSAFVRNASANVVNGEPLLRKATPVNKNLGAGTKTASGSTKSLEFNLMHPTLREFAAGIDAKITEVSHLRSVK